jgi:hypothetical protein
VIHERLLTQRSEFFRAALTGRFKEARDKTVRLEDDDPMYFEFFVHWLYYNDFPAKGKGDDEAILEAWDCGQEGGAKKSASLIHMYILGDKYDVPALRIAAMDTLFHHVVDDMETHLPDWNAVGYAYDHINNDSPLCRFLVDVHCYLAQPDGWKAKDLPSIPQVFLIKALQTYSTIALGTGMRYEPKPCDYHEHQNIEQKRICKHRPIW